jgi:putative ABC transport system permease protein
MNRVALKSLLHRKTRALLTALAIVLGVSMISGTYVLTDTIDRAFNDIFAGSYRDTSAVISGREVVKGSGAAPIPARLLDRVKRLPEVEAAGGALMDLSGEASAIDVLGADGKPLGGPAPTFGFGIDTSQPRFNPLKLTDGAWAAGPDELVLDAGTAKQHDFAVGDTVSLSAGGSVRKFRVAGVARYGSVDSLGGATIAVFTIPTAQELLGKPGALDTISLAARAGVSPERLVQRVRPLLPRSAQVQTADQRAHADAKDTKTFIRFMQMFLLAFAVIALFVGGFVIFNTLSITVAQRAREFATVRMLGASRGQVLRSVLLEGTVLGAVASAAGLGLGLVLAKGLSAAMRAFDLDLPQASTVFATRTVVVSLAIGVLVTVAATLAPALRATRVSPIAAVREGAVVPPSRMAAAAPRVSVAVLLAAVGALAVGSFAGGLGTGSTLLALGLGSLGLFLGVALVAPRLVRPLAAALGAPARRLGGSAGALAQRNATRNPGRTATTAAALMIGLALVTVVATLGAGLRHSTAAALSDQVKADYVISSEDGFARYAERAGQLPSMPGVGVASAVLEDRARALGADVSVAGVDPATIGRTYAFSWAPGSSAAALDRLGVDGAIVKRSFADRHRLRVGSRFTLTTPSGRPVALVVRGIHAPPAFDKVTPVIGPVAIAQRTFVRAFPRPKIRYGFLTLDRGAAAGLAAGPAAAGLGADPAAAPDVTVQIKQLAERYPGAKVETRDEWIAAQTEGINKLLNLLYVLLALSVVVSLFGMVNTLVLAVFERTRELGMLRTVGMSRRQVRRMIRHESTITALIGAGLGLPVGLFLAAMVTRALSSQGLAFALPVTSLVVFVVVAIAAGLLAAVLPARRAARLDMLRALQYE